jgi:SNF2 family DNA or RNA helicase
VARTAAEDHHRAQRRTRRRQRDLYETVRAAMDAKVRRDRPRGFARSQIVILDALLKLRQVCCDPRLVKTGIARKVPERAKLDLLMAMLPELVDEAAASWSSRNSPACWR